MALPEASGFVAGPSVGAGFRFQELSEALVARLEAGSVEPGAARLVEGALVVEGRVWIGRSLRFVVGGEAALGTLHLGDALGVDRITGDRDTWTARAGAIVGAELRLKRGLWLGLDLVPGALLRPVPYETGAMAAGSLRGATFGTKLTLTFERPRAPTRRGSMTQLTTPTSPSLRTRDSTKTACRSTARPSSTTCAATTGATAAWPSAAR